MLITFTCRSCGRLFEAASPHARTCSQACRQAVYRTRQRETIRDVRDVLDDLLELQRRTAT
ncbi:hypothetical protein DZF92_04620 [Clavibacter michiganensis subsp. insidiosus]|uniref:Uncharacterized protein n=1 Tax=Clavibacter michiganensis subsp. insidiosus TaxID=33014 RepID=A0A0D5CGK1_9MICO|nr:hypothetical protein [Clavibacter michiganensis]AJW78741.1 hypothetical protein VO01_05985 [Clavibacter michiganensis subsp. insidiosus]AWG01190.1 hypothetical protein BEH62_06220 [Clavibacter michiganensis subsp. insidiosus]OQJ60251.1 hypothetical protein B5P21_10270 [Clavibacter michiganensis subsp. insidiosus]RII88052.1 hypothetical protein DZF92_04620 [Clavibacter michiganensis subsp. insidiosus]RIJ43904.1 hypothetical protein DZF93_04850 [Clavibacter michiganensis subsp. insidiosus]